ncbi:MAG: hypothetical protein HLX48_02030 [Halomonas sp.]|uniref:hypothetical protein n=1 Tax=Halomonas TaxID=2745 RepID=UPI0007E5AB34|nr:MULTISPECIES: hypothetical protein [Halomonas]NWN81762.1 hypothetical protein [Halomonas sp.]SEN69680.1 hypothetical protein SAMN04487952_1253 [Halomonas caseinilytica]
MKYRKKIFYAVLHATLDVADRSATTMAAACIVAALLGTVIQPDKVNTAYVGAFTFFMAALIANSLKSLLNEEDES